MLVDTAILNESLSDDLKAAFAKWHQWRKTQ